MDVFYVGVTGLFFAVTGWLVRFFGNLGGSK